MTKPNKNNIDEVQFENIVDCIDFGTIDFVQSQKNLDKVIKEVEQNSLKNFVERLRGDLILHPDLENLNEIITKRLVKSLSIKE